MSYCAGCAEYQEALRVEIQRRKADDAYALELQGLLLLVRARIPSAMLNLLDETMTVRIDAALAKNPNPSGHIDAEAFGSLHPRASGPVGLGPDVPVTGHIPPGWKLVPAEATDAMWVAGGNEIIRQYLESTWDEAKEVAEDLNAGPIWTAMLAVAPTTPSSGTSHRTNFSPTEKE